MDTFQESLSNSSSAYRHIFHPIRAVLKPGNTYRIPPVPELSAGPESSAVSACRRNRSFLKKLLCCAVALLLFTGCTRQTPEQTLPVFTPTIEATEAPSYRQSTLFTRVDIPQVDYISGIQSLGGGKFVVCAPDYEGESVTLYLCDVSRREVVDSVETEGLFELAGGYNGVFAIMGGDCLRIVDGSLKIMSEFSLPEPYGAVSSDLRNYYYVQEEVLYRLDLSNGQSYEVTVSGGQSVGSINGVDPLSGQLSLSLYTRPFGYDMGEALLNPATGELLFFREDAHLYSCYDGTPVWSRSEDGVPWLFWKDGTRSVLQNTLPAPDLDIISGSDFLQGFSYQEGHSLWLYQMDDTVSCWDLCALGAPEEMIIRCALREEQLLAATVTGEDGARLYLVDTRLLPQPQELPPEETQQIAPVNEDLLAQAVAQPELPELPENLADLRQRADALEEAWDIQILLSRQCGAFTGLTDFSFATTDILYDEPALISEALTRLEAGLERFPQGFFSRFRQGNDRGVYVLLTGVISSDYGVVGFSGDLRSGSVIALDIAADPETLTGCFCHEVWHAIEDHFSGQIDPDLFDQWEQCNPRDFTYDESYYSGKVHDWTYLGGADVFYFVDDYSCSFASEDRARLMEYLLCYPDQAEALLTSPAIRAKADILRRMVESGFGMWQDAPWDAWRYE